MIKNQHELKGLETRRSILEVEIKNLEYTKRRIKEDINRKITELNIIRKKIKDFTVKEPIVTEHAILRYLERVMGIDLRSIVDKILTRENKELIRFSGNCTIEDGRYKYIVKNHSVVSVEIKNKK